MTLVLSLGQLCDLPGSRLLKRPRDSSFITNAPRDFDRWKALRNIQLSLQSVHAPRMQAAHFRGIRLSPVTHLCPALRHPITSLTPHSDAQV